MALLGHGRLDGSSHNEKEEHYKAQHKCAERVHGQNLLRNLQYPGRDGCRTVLPVTAEGDVICRRPRQALLDSRSPTLSSSRNELRKQETFLPNPIKPGKGR
jgi:hypothetical protein